MSTVFIVQDSKWVDPRDGQLKSKFDFTAAKQFGELEYLLEPGASPFDLPPVLDRLRRKLDGYDYTKAYLLLVGSPVLIGLAVAIAADQSDGNVAMLQWSGAKRQYVPARAFNVF